MVSLGTLTAGVAHEINNPLNFISGGLNMIKDMQEEGNFQSEEINEKLNIGTGMVNA